MQLRTEFRAPEQDRIVGLLYLDGERVAHLICKSSAGSLRIKELYTKLDHRQRGFATQLMQAFVDSHGGEEITVKLRTFGPEPRAGIRCLERFFEQFGFEQVGQSVLYLRPADREGEK